MGTFLFAAICAASLSLGTATQPVDTVAKYVINGEVTLNFDGSQLVGKNIVDYDIILTKEQKNGTVAKVHMIKTSSNSVTVTGTPSGLDQLSGKLSGFKHLPNDYIYVLNGKIVERSEFDIALSSLPPEKISQMTIHKAGSPNAVKYSGKDDVKVMEIELKGYSTPSAKAKVLYLVDGKTVTEAEANSLPSTKIKSISVLKAGNAEAVKVSGNQITTVMKIETK